jgi:ABC-type multidrug transport system, ATPase component
VAIVDSGKVIAIGTPREIQASTLGHSNIEIHVDRPLGDIPASPEIERTTFGKDRKSVVIASSKPARTLVDLVKWIDQQGLDLIDIQLRRPTLEDVFIELTGKKLRE